MFNVLKNFSSIQKFLMSATSLVGVVPNIRGRVVSSSDDAQTEDGLYVCGWLKRGPTGIIATNVYKPL